MIVENQIDLFIAELIAEGVIVLFMLIICIILVVESDRLRK